MWQITTNHSKSKQTEFCHKHGKATTLNLWKAFEYTNKQEEYSKYVQN